MTALPDCLLIVTAEVDASVEADWNRWYDDVHLPDALACPGVLAGRRYVSVGRDLRKRPRPGQAHPDQALHHGLRARIRRPRSKRKEFKAMRGWGRFSPQVRSQTRVVVPVK